MQSKITELEDRNGELIREVKRLQQENQNVDSRMAALVRLVHQKNGEIEQLKAAVCLLHDLPADAQLTLDHCQIFGVRKCNRQTAQRLHVILSSGPSANIF